MSNTTAQRKRVVVIGAGFGGLSLAKALTKSALDVLLIDENNFHLFQPLLYQVATAGLGIDDIAYAVRGIFRRRANISFRLARVERIDLDRAVVSSEGGEVGYDYLVMAAGAITNDYGIEGVDQHSFGLKSLGDATALRSHVLAEFERAAAAPSVDEANLTVVVAGGGPTGVELAGGLIELFQHVLAKDFPELAKHKARVVLVEASDRVLPTFDPRLSERARRALLSRGVDVRLSTSVRRVDRDRVELGDGETIATSTIVWTAGVKANPLAQALGVELNGAGRVTVRSDLSVAGRDNVFAIGDIAGAVGADGRLLPQVAPVAMQQGRHVARQIIRLSEGQKTSPFVYRDKGSMATIGRRYAVCQLPIGLRLSGSLGWLAWLGLHLVYLVGFRNRASVLLNWCWNYLTYDRAARFSSVEAEGDQKGSL